AGRRLRQRGRAGGTVASWRRTVAGAPEVFAAGVREVLEARSRREGVLGGTVPVRVAAGGERVVAEGAAQLLLGPLFGRGDG
ncbi:hypothetical protein ACFZA1_03920, partial [Streptomyces filipinensis]